MEKPITCEGGMKPKVCLNCKHSYTLPASGKYRRCALSKAKLGSDDTLCGSMRATPPKKGCGPAATLFEARGATNGQA